MLHSTTLHVGGLCEAGSFELSFADCLEVPERHRVPDLGTLLPGRKGAAVRFAAILERAAPAPEVRHVNVASSDGSFTASLPLDDVAQSGVLLYALGVQPLPARLGGPFRLFVIGAEDCSINVKFLSDVELTAGPGSHTARCADEAAPLD